MNKRGVACPAMGLTYRHYGRQVRYVGKFLRQDHLLLNKWLNIDSLHQNSWF